MGRGGGLCKALFREQRRQVLLRFLESFAFTVTECGLDNGKGRGVVLGAPEKNRCEAAEYEKNPIIKNLLPLNVKATSFRVK